MNQSLPNILGPQSPTENKPFDPWLLWVTLRRCWHWAVPVGLVLGCLAGLAVLKTFVPKFRASHILETNNEFILYKDVMPTFGDLAQTERAIILNSVVLDDVVNDPSLRSAPSLGDAEAAEQQLRANLKVTGAGSRQRMMVTYTETDRDYAARVCNAVVSNYLRVRADADQTRVNKLESLLVPEIDYWESEVERLQDKYKELTKSVGSQAGLLSADTNQSVIVGRVQELNNQIGGVEVEISMARAKLELIQQEHAEEAGVEPLNSEDLDEFQAPLPNFARGEIDYDEVASRVEKDSAVIKANSEMQRFEQQVTRMEDLGTDRLYQSDYREKRRNRDAAVARLEAERKVVREKVIAAMNELLDSQFEEQQRQYAENNKQLQAQFDADRQRRRAAREMKLRADQREMEQGLISLIEEKRGQQKLLEEQLREAQADQEFISEQATELQFTESDLERAKGILNKLQDRAAQIRTERRQLVAVRSLAKATPPRMPVESMPFKQLVLASGLGFGFPFLLGLAWEMRTNRVTDSLALDRYTGLAPVVGELAKSPTAGSSRGSRNRRVFQESVDTLRANLFLSKDTRESRSIAIVSSMSGEGKSTTASQLAISLAKASGKTVLLVDGDMRCPDQHDVFGLPLGPGLSGVLSDEANLDDAICTELGDLIHVLPAGRLKASPHRLMSPEAMKELVNEALEKYEFVIFDTAPVLSAGETLAVASAVDSTLVCAMRDVTRMDSVVRTTHRLESAGANVAGTVFNGVTPRQYAYRYGDYNYSNFVEFAEANREG
ncbi:MAG: polysaccharide biosynthesis tyrosine autokinase [Planctomycetota bacterium]